MPRGSSTYDDGTPDRRPAWPARLGRALAALCVSAGAARGQGFPIQPVDSQPWSYVAPPLQGHCLQSYRLFLPPPDLSMPADGWPVLLHFDDSKLDGITEVPANSLLGLALARGVAVIAARATLSLPTDDALWTSQCGAVDFPGNGLFHPPGRVAPDLLAEGIAPYDHPDYHNREKDAVMVIQHVRHLARQTAPLPDVQAQSMALLDHRRIAVHGSSSGASALLWAIVGPERSQQLPFVGLGGQYAESARPHLALLDRPDIFHAMLDPTLAPPEPHFGLAGHSQIGAPTMAEADPLDILGLSPLGYGDPAFVEAVPLHLTYHEWSASEDYTPNSGPACDPYPFCFDGQGQEGGPGQPGVHPAWSGYTWKTLHPGSTQLVITDPTAYLQAHGVEALPLFDGVAAQLDEAIAWTRQELDGLVSYLAPPAATLVAGDRVQGELAPDAIHSLELEAPAGARLNVKLKRLAGGLQPGVRVVGPDGVVLVAAQDSVQGSKSAAVVGLPITQSGRHRVEALGLTADGGSYVLRTALKAPRKLSQRVTVGGEAGEESMAFEVVAGTLLKSLKVRRVGPPPGAPPDVGGQLADLHPLVASLVGPDELPLDLTGLVTLGPSGHQLVLAPLTLEQTGTYTLTIAGADGSTGYGRVRLRLARPTGHALITLP